MVLAAGLTSRREPASHSRRLIEFALMESFELVLTDTLLGEAYDVLTDPSFVARVSEDEAATLLGGLVAAASIVVGDRGLTFSRLTDDEDDDYVADAALKTGAFLVTRDDHANFGKVQGLESGGPGTALRRIGAFGHEESA